MCLLYTYKYYLSFSFDFSVQYLSFRVYFPLHSVGCCCRCRLRCRCHRHCCCRRYCTPYSLIVSYLSLLVFSFILDSRFDSALDNLSFISRCRYCCCFYRYLLICLLQIHYSKPFTIFSYLETSGVNSTVLFFCTGKRKRAVWFALIFVYQRPVKATIEFFLIR